MATPAFGPAREAALKENIQGARLTLLKQWVDNPQFFCCISGTTVGVAKDPVCVLEVERVVCVDEDVELDFSRSWSPTDTLAGTAYTIHWGDGSTTMGNFPNPRDPLLEVETYVGGYMDVGFYDIWMEIEDSLGATAIGHIQTYAELCPAPALLGPAPGEPVDGVPIMIPAGYNVRHTTNWTDAVPTWQSSTDWGDRAVQWGSLMYFASSPNRIFGAAWGETQTAHTGTHGVILELIPTHLVDGVFTTKVTALDIATDLGHSADYYGVFMNDIISGLMATQEGYGWAEGVCFYNGGGGFADRYALHFCARTYDAWDTFSCSEIDTYGPFGGSNIHNHHTARCGMAQDLRTGYLYVPLMESSAGNASRLRLYRSMDGGVNWSEAHDSGSYNYEYACNRTGALKAWTDVFIPYGPPGWTGGTVFWSGWTVQYDMDSGSKIPYPARIYKSTSHGGAPARLDTSSPALGQPNDPQHGPIALFGPYNGIGDHLYAIANYYYMRTDHGYDPTIYEWESGVGWSVWGSVAVNPTITSPEWYVRVTTPNMIGTQIPTHVGWHQRPYETSAAGDADKYSAVSGRDLIPVEY